MSTERRLPPYPRKLLLLSAFALVAFSRLTVVVASTQTTSLVRDDLDRNEKASATIASRSDAVHGPTKRHSKAQAHSSTTYDSEETKKASAMIALAPRTVHSQVRRQSPTQMHSTLSYEFKRKEERCSGLYWEVLQSVIQCVCDTVIVFHPIKAAYVNRLFLKHVHQRFSSYLFHKEVFHNLCKRIHRVYPKKKDAIAAIYNVLCAFKTDGNVYKEMFISLLFRLVDFKKHNLRWQKMSLPIEYKDKAMWKIGKNEGTTNGLLQADKELKSYYDLKRTHPSMSDAFGKNLEVSVSENHQLYS